MRGIVIALLVFCFTPAPAEPYPKGADAVPVLHDVWRIAKATIHPTTLAERFDDEQLAALEEKLERDDQAALADVLNPFLDELGVSHTRFFDRRHQTYYMLRSLFTTHNLDVPMLYTIGVQLDDRELGRVRAVLEGSAAAHAGIERGDRIVEVNGDAFDSVLQWQAYAPVKLLLATARGEKTVELTPKHQSVHRALVDATKASHREIGCGSGTVAYLHLWSGTNDAFLDALKGAVRAARDAELDGFVLDLRDGYGGAWWPYLDPFFVDRSSYFEARMESSGTPWIPQVDPQVNDEPWTGPLAVLINGGTRSGKESLAFQFRKTGRAQLVGETTAGAFTAGRGVFAERDGGYMLYLSVGEFLLDEQRLEGVGVEPDVVVREVAGRDAPLAAALEYLGCVRG